MNILTLDVETTHIEKLGGGTTALPHFGNRLVSVGWKWLLNDHDNYKFFYHKDNENIRGLDRGNLGILFARPEVGKTTFWCFLAASYIRQGFQVV